MTMVGKAIPRGGELRIALGGDDRGPHGLHRGHEIDETGYDSKLDLRYLFFRGLNLIGATQGTRAGLEKVVKWTSKGKIKAIIDTVYPFEDMVMGHIKMMESQLFGKLVTTPQKL